MRESKQESKRESTQQTAQSKQAESPAWGNSLETNRALAPQTPHLQPPPQFNAAQKPQMLLQLQQHYGNRATTRWIQTKLAIGQPDDRFEQEADRVAAQVMTMSEPRPSAAPETPEEIQPPPSVQLQPTLAAVDPPTEASDSLESQLLSSKGQGSPLPDQVRAFMEPRFGVDLSSVRVHTDRNAAQMNQTLEAHAFTYGNDIYYGAGKSPAVSELTAHELTHVVQQVGDRLNSNSEQRIQRDNPKKPTEDKLFFTRPVTEEMLAWTPEELAAHMFASILNRSKAYVREQMQRAPTDPQHIRLIGDWKVTQAQLQKKEFSFFLSAPAYYRHRAGSEGTEDLARNNQGQAEGYEQRQETFSKLSPQDQSAITSEANRRYWEGLGDEQKTPIKSGQTAESQFWLNIRDEILHQRQQIQNLPDQVKLIIRPEGKKVIEPKDYAQVIRIARKIMTFDNLDLSTYLQRDLTVTDDWNTLEKSIDRFLAFKAQAKEKIADVTKLAEDEDWDVDEEAAKLSAEEMRYLSLPARLKLIRYIADGYSVLDEDEQTLIKLIVSTPAADAKALLESLKQNNASVLKRLEKVIDGQENKEYYGALRNILFQSMEPQSAMEAMQKAKIFPWADPGIIKAVYNRRFYYEEVELTGGGKLKVVYWINFAGTGIKTEAQYLDPYEIVGVHFFMDEEFANTKAGQTVYMPAINLIALKNKQFETELNTVVDITLLFAGGVGLAAKGTRLAKAVAALDLTLGAAAVVINDFRSEIGSTEEGKKFLKAWDIVNTAIAVYGLTRVVIELPNIVRNVRSAYQEFRQSASGLNPSKLKQLDAETNTLFKQADEAIAEAGAAPKATGTEPVSIKPADPVAPSLDDLRASLNGKVPDAILAKLPEEDLKALNLLDQQALKEIQSLTKVDEIAKLSQLIRQDADLVNRLLREAPFEDLEAFSKRFGRAQKRVAEPVSGLYASVDADNPPANWKIRTRPPVGNKIRSDIEYTKPDGSIETGHMIRSYDPTTGTFVMEEAFLDKLPSFIESGTAMVPKQGTPLVTFLTIHQMKKLGLAYSGIKKVKMSTIQNFDTILHLHWLKKKYPGKSLDELILQTHSVSYAETAIIQSGHKVIGAKVGGADVWDKRVGWLMQHYEGADPRNIAKHDALLKKYGFDRNETVLMNFDIELHLAPFK